MSARASSLARVRPRTSRDHDAVRAAIEPDTRGINRVVEFWLPWQDAAAGAEPEGDETPAETTTRIEAAWTEHTIENIRSRTP